MLLFLADKGKNGQETDGLTDRMGSSLDMTKVKCAAEGGRTCGAAEGAALVVLGNYCNGGKGYSRKSVSHFSERKKTALVLK